MEENKYCYKYPHPAVTTDCVIFGFNGERLQVLLIERGIEPYKGRWAFPGGFLKMDETAEEGALRELKEETGLENAYIQQLHTFSDPNRDPRERVITIAYYALVRIHILRMATQRLREQIHFQPIGFELLPEKFTIKELQSLYEAILGINFDRRNFAKKMLHLEILTELDETIWPTPKREAKLYKFNSEKYEELKRKGFRIEF